MDGTVVGKECNKLSFISFLQIFGILLVVIGHSFHEYPVNHGTDTLAYNMIYSFHMPLFMWVSGFLFKYSSSRGKTYKYFFQGKFVRLILPYLVLSLITFIPRGMMNEAADSLVDISFAGLIRSLFFYDSLVIPFFWFLQALFIIMNITFGIGKLDSKKENIAVILGIGLSILVSDYRYSVTFLSLGSAGYFLIYYLLGYLSCKYFNGITLLCKGWVLFIVYFGLWLWCNLNAQATYWWEFATALAGILFSVSLSMQLVRWIRDFGIFEGCSYMIFLLSWYPGVICQQVLHHYTEFDWWVYSILAVSASVFIPIFIFKVLNHYADDAKWANWILFFLGHKKITRRHDEQSL